MHPALRSWRDELPSSFVRLLAYLGAIVLLSTAATYIFQAKKVPLAATSVNAPKWIAVERPIPAFALSIPEAADVPAGYAILRHISGGGRKDILTLGERDSSAPFLQVEIYRPGSESESYGLRDETDNYRLGSARQIYRLGNETDNYPPGNDSETYRLGNETDNYRLGHESDKFALLPVIAAEAASLVPVDLRKEPEPLETKFGKLDTATFRASAGTQRECRAFGRGYNDPRLQLSGWFCQGGALVKDSTLACALDRLTLLSAGSEPKVGALFAQAELHRSYCGQHDPILAATPKYHLLWKALANRPQPRRIGR
jgi:hypothetical protein